MKVRAHVKFMLGRGMGVKKNNGSSDIKWNGKFRMLDEKRDITIERVMFCIVGGDITNSPSV